VPRKRKSGNATKKNVGGQNRGKQKKQFENFYGAERTSEAAQKTDIFSLEKKIKENKHN
jgi:hypothetical protein